MVCGNGVKSYGTVVKLASLIRSQNVDDSFNNDKRSDFGLLPANQAADMADC